MSVQSSNWITESSSTQKNIALVLMLVVGTALTAGFWGVNAASDVGSKAGFLLGLLILGLGICMFLFAGKQIIAVEPQSKRITITSAGRFRTRSKVINFNEVADVYVDEHGDREGGSVRYFVAAKLKTGKTIALFMGFFEGSYSRSAMQARCQRLSECIASAQSSV